MNISKSFVGAGMLALPYAMSQAGLMVARSTEVEKTLILNLQGGIVALFIVALISRYSIRSLIRIKNVLLAHDQVNRLKTKKDFLSRNFPNLIPIFQKKKIKQTITSPSLFLGLFEL